MPQYYDDEFKKKNRSSEIRRRTNCRKALFQEYGVSQSSITKWCQESVKECQSNPEAKKI